METVVYGEEKRNEGVDVAVRLIEPGGPQGHSPSFMQ